MTTTEQKDSHDYQRKCENSHCENPIPETTQYYNRAVKFIDHWGMRFCSTSCGIDWYRENRSRD